MAEEYAVNVDLAVLRDAEGKALRLLAWGDPVGMVTRDARRIEVEVTDWRAQADGSLKPVTTTGFLRRKVRIDGRDRQVALPAGEVRVLKVSFVDVQQGDGTLIQTPSGRVILLDGGENQLFARFLAGRFRGTSPEARQQIDAIVVSHGDADHFRGLAEIQESEDAPKLPGYKRLFARPVRVMHNGLVKRPSSRPELEQFGATRKVGKTTVVTELVGDLLAVPAGEMNRPFQAWRKALKGWSEAAGPIEFRRLARGDSDAFDFLADEQIGVDVLGPIETPVDGEPGLAFLGEPREGRPMAHLDFEPGAPSASHTVNGHSIVLRLRFGNVRMLFAGDLNNSAEERLVAEHPSDLRSEIFKVPHHGSHEFTPGFLKAVAPLISVVSSGDESSIKEYVHPRATLMSALGRHARDDTGLVFVTEMVAFFEAAGWVRPTGKAQAKQFFGFRRSAFGCVRVRTDGEHLLVFTDTGKRDLKEAYAYDLPRLGETRPVEVRKA